MKTIAQALATLEERRASLGYDTTGYPRPPAEPNEIRQLEQNLGGQLHPDVVAWFLYGNGVKDVPSSFFFGGCWLLDIMESTRSHRSLLSLSEELEHLKSMEPYLALLAQDGVYIVVRWRASDPSEVRTYDPHERDFLAPLASTLPEAIEKWTTELEPPTNWAVLE